MEKKNIGMKVAIIILSLLVVGLTGYVVYDKVLSDNDTNITDENNNTNNDNNQSDNEDNQPVDCNVNSNLKINVDELHKIGGMADFYFIKRVYTDDSSFNLSTDGRVYISFDNYISNISNAVDIQLFSNTLYILTNDGYIYKYSLNNSNNYKATKINEYSNVVRIILYETRKNYAGGCDYFVIIDAHGKYYKLDSLCV